MTVVANLSVRVGADVGPLKTGLAQANSQVTGFGGKVTSALDKVGIGGALALGAITAGAVAFGKASIDSAVSFDKSMTNVNSILQLSQDEIGELSSDILAFGATTRAGPQMVAEAFTEIVGGVADATTHMAILQAAVAASEAGNADLTATTGALVSVMNSYGFAAEKAAFVSDVMTKTVGDGVGSMDEFASAMGMTAGLAAQAGIEFDALGGSMAYLTTQGFSAAQAGTRLTAIVTAFLKPNKKMTDALELMGLESGSAGLEMYGLAGMTGLLQEALGGSTDAMSAALGTTEALTGALALNKPEFEDFITNFEGATDGATEAARAIQNASTAASFERMNAQLERAQILLGGMVVPVLEGAANIVVTGLQAGADISAEAAKLGTLLGTIAAQEASKAWAEKLNIDPTFKLRADGDRGPIRQAMMDYVKEPGGIPISVLLDPRFSFAADVADDIAATVKTEIAGVKPIEMLLSTLPKLLPPAIPNTIAAMNDLISGIQAHGLSPTQSLIFNAQAEVVFNKSEFDLGMQRVKNDVYAANNPLDFSGVGGMINDGAGTFAGPPPTPMTWVDEFIANTQAAVDAAVIAANPLKAAFDFDATLTPTINRTETDPLITTTVKEYASTVLKGAYIEAPADLHVTPTLINGPLIESEMTAAITALNYDPPATSAIRIMAGLANGSDVSAAITTGLQAQNYDATVQAKLAVIVNPQVIYNSMPSGATGSGTNYDGTPDNDGMPWTPMKTGGKVPYDNFAALLHKDEIVVPANYADAMTSGRGGGAAPITVIIQGGVFANSEAELAELVSRIMKEKAA